MPYAHIPRNIPGITRDTTEPQHLNLRLPDEPCPEPVPSPLPGMIIATLAGFGMGVALTAFLLP